MLVPVPFSGFDLRMCGWLAIDGNHAEGLHGMVLSFVRSCYWKVGIRIGCFCIPGAHRNIVGGCSGTRT